MKPKAITVTSKTMGLAVIFLCFTIYLYGLTAQKLFTLPDLEHPTQSVFMYVVFGLISTIVALIFASVSLHRHPAEKSSVINWWLVFTAFVLSLAFFGIVFYKYAEEIGGVAL